MSKGGISRVNIHWEKIDMFMWINKNPIELSVVTKVDGR